MDKLNIKNLTQNESYDFKDFDINSLSNVGLANSYDNILKFNADILIKKRIEKREKLLNIYLKYYKICVEKITQQNNVNKYDLFFNVPNYIVECPEYNGKNCILYIQEKLKNNHFDTFIIENNTIFITWKYLELNKDF
jgi:hypothetical protein